MGADRVISHQIARVTFPIFSNISNLETTEKDRAHRFKCQSFKETNEKKKQGGIMKTIAYLLFSIAFALTVCFILVFQLTCLRGD